MSRPHGRRLIQIEAPSITKHIARTLDRYPDGGQILKELIQNADDAEATEVKFILDCNQYPTDGLVHPNLSQFQGPALYAWNNAVFKDKDWDYFGKMEDSSKEKDALKVGRFGVGFLSVFHITDLPMVISTDTAAMLDPHKKYTGTDRRGWNSTLADFLHYIGHAACFAYLGSCSIQPGTTYYPATIFRFPLRIDGTSSEISSNSYSPQRVVDFLYKSFLHEAPVILLFLKHVEEISLYNGDKLLFRVSIHPDHKELVRSERQELIKVGLSRPASPFLGLYSMTTCVDMVTTTDPPNQYHWLIFNMIGSSFDDVRNLSQKLQILPWVGVAAPLPSLLTLQGIHLTDLDLNRLSGVLLGLHNVLKRHVITLPWCNEVQGHTKGHAFCFLPLPSVTHLPVNIHGYFAIGDNRRSIKWPSFDNESEEAMWNNKLVLKHIAPLYAITIGCRSQLIQYKGTPLPVYGVDQRMSDPYAAWPLSTEVRHMEIWNELVSPTVEVCLQNPVFWSIKGQWVTISQAVLLPKSSKYSIPPKAIEILVSASVPVVCLPNAVWQTLEECSVFKSQNIKLVSPLEVRNAIRKTKFSFKSSEELQPVLEYCLSDLDDGNYSLLEGLNMIPLATKDFQTRRFSSDLDVVYVLTLDNSKIMNFLPGTETSFVSHSMMMTSMQIGRKFTEMASKRNFQLRNPLPFDVCKKLLPVSIRSWAQFQPNGPITWTPNTNGHPPVQWIVDLWSWLCHNPSVLPEATGLPILPRDLIHDAITVCKLQPIPSGHTKYYVSQAMEDEDQILTYLFDKLGAITVSNNRFVFMHKRISEFVLPATVPHLLNHLTQINLSKVSSLTTNDKHSLRCLIAQHYSRNVLPPNLQKLVMKLPIFEVGVGGSPVVLTSLESRKYLLPPHHMRFHDDLQYSPNILKNDSNDVYALISKSLNYDIASQDDVILAILAFAINTECPASKSWCNGDNLILWIITSYPDLSKKVIGYLSDKHCIRTNSNLLRAPKDLYNPVDEQFHRLFNNSTDNVFPCNNYSQYGALNVLINLGLKTWSSIVKDPQTFTRFLAGRAKSVSSLPSEEAFNRSCYILEVIGLHRQYSKHLIDSLKSIQFLRAEPSPPDDFPNGLFWHGVQCANKLMSPSQMCYSTGDTHYLVGSILPIISHRYAESMRIGLPLTVTESFLSPKVDDVICQLNGVITALPNFQSSEIDKILSMVRKIYSYLNTTTSSYQLPKRWILCDIEGKYDFMSADKFIMDSSSMDLSPFIYSISQVRQLAPYCQLVQKSGIRRFPTCEELVGILQSIKQTISTPLNEKFIIMTVNVLSYLEKNKHRSSSNVLLLTIDCTLRPASECTFDDREWGSRSIVSQNLSLLHPKIPPYVAKYFGVEALSQKIAPSSKLKFKYTQIGQKENLTRKLQGIVNDYCGDIDFFKEMIQNADDAFASEVKFVLDFRKHNTQSLFHNAMRYWQGSAVLSYNNATFSDQDFDNICSLAGETKMDDPLKTGRFGIGFNASYSLTDVPSFVSRRYLTIFDPHTRYLGDRVSRNEPGMRLDLVAEKEDLKEYRDQLVPFNGVFGCDIFDLPHNGFNGTIFRFPIRTRKTPHSEICGNTYEDRQVKFMMDDLEKESQRLLIFMKHVTSLEVYALYEKAASASEMKLLFKVEKQCEQSSISRVDLIKMYNKNPKQKDHSHCSQIKTSFSKTGKGVVDCNYVLASAISPSLDTEAKAGMVPMGEIAIKVNNGCVPKPENDCKLFCFLPLPFKSHLPFHINGFFDVGKDRRGLRQAEDSREFTWNNGLVQKSLPMAFESALHYIATHVQLSKFDKKQRVAFLDGYYSLWPDPHHSTVPVTWISSEFTKSVNRVLPLYIKCILWSGNSSITGGEWVSIRDAFFFSKSTWTPDEIETDAIHLLQDKGCKVVQCPNHVYQLLCSFIQSNNRMISYKAFFEKYFIQCISTLSKETRDKHLKFVLELYRRNRDQTFEWIKAVLTSNQCIPVKESSALSQPQNLVDVNTKHIANLFDVSEGRFVADDYSDYTDVLTLLGMVKQELPVTELTRRALSVTAMSKEKRMERVQYIFNYILMIESGPYRQGESDKSMIALSHVSFLKPFSNPYTESIPWYAVSKPFYSPSELHHHQYLCLLFSQKPVFHPSDYPCIVSRKEDFPSILRVNTDQPNVVVVLNNLCCLMKKLVPGAELDEKSQIFLDTAFREMYTFLSARCDTREIHKRLTNTSCIWQEKRLLHPSQVIAEGDVDCFPYLCSLSQTNKQFLKLFTSIGVEESPSSKFILSILKRLKDNYGENQLSPEHLELVDFLTKKLAVVYNRGIDKMALLPDNEGVLRYCDKLSSDNVSSLEDNQWVHTTKVFSDFISKGGHFLHPSIPQERARCLGALTLMNALLKDIEDQSFLNETEFGQYEDLIDRLNGILKKYPPDISIFKEFIQNSDDAGATEVAFILDCRVDHPSESLLLNQASWKRLQSVPALCIFNNRPFSKEDIKGICKLGRGAKGETSDTIGRFGIGFNVAYHLTDCPMFVSFDRNASPTDFCVFDPLKIYCANTCKSPGRRWKNDNGSLNQFSDQLSPFMVNIFSHIQSIIPSCFKNRNKGFTVFRLPLIHWSPGTGTGDFTKNDNSFLHEGRIHGVFAVRQLLSQLKLSSDNMLLFLNNIKHMSVFEVRKSGECFHHFSTESLINAPKQPSQEVIITTRENRNERHSITKWIVHKQFGFNNIPEAKKLCAPAKQRGLEAVGGTATIVDYSHSLQGLLFCFLPLSIQSCLPVHLNGYFLLDDSRNHLGKVIGLEKWNFYIAEYLLVPSYVQLILKAKEYVNNSNNTVRWFYSLFPDLNSGSVSAATELNINQLFYKCLLAENHSVFLHRVDNGVSNTSSCSKWLSIKVPGQFFMEFHSKDKRISISDENLRSVLLSLGMPITCAPSHVFHGFCKATGNSYASLGLLTPEKVVNFLQNIDLNDESRKMILENCVQLLEFCLQDCTSSAMIQLRVKNTPILKSKAGTLVKTGILYSLQYSDLLPNHSDQFAHYSLTQGDIGRKLVEGNVVVTPSIDFIARHIDLPDVDKPVKLSNDSKQLIKSLWGLLKLFSSRDCLHTLKNKPILPSSVGLFYPSKLRKCLFKRTKEAAAMLSALQKLGYPTLDFSSLSIKEPHFVNQLISFPFDCNGIVSAMEQLPPSLNVKLNEQEYNALISILGRCVSIPEQVCVSLRGLPLFETFSGNYCCLEAKTVSKFVFVPLTVPLAGLEVIEKASKTVFLKHPTETQDRFYSKVFDQKEYGLAKMLIFQFHLRFIIPNLPCLTDSQVKYHLKAIDELLARIEDRNRKLVINMLQQTPLIAKNHKRHLVSSFYDPEIEFHAVFNSNSILPKDWTKEKVISQNLLHALGLNFKISNEEWLEVAQNRANQWQTRISKSCQQSLECHRFQTDLDVLVECFTDKVTSHVQTSSNLNSSFSSFLSKSCSISFLYCPNPPEVENLLRRVVSWSPPKQFNNLIQPSGAAFSEHENILCLTCPILPTTFNFLQLIKGDCRTKIWQALSIVDPITSTMVVENLIQLSKAIISSNVKVCAPSKSRQKDVLALKKIFNIHYEFLDKHCNKDGYRACTRLCKKRCVLISPDNMSLTMVKPAQFVKQSNVSLEPFYLQLPSQLQRYPDFWKAVGVRDELNMVDFLGILLEIKKLMVEMKMESLKDDARLCKVCNNVYTLLIVKLRKKPPDFALPKDLCVVLPTIDFKLLENTKLIYNDTPWIANCIGDPNMQFLLPPTRDANGQNTPPSCLCVKNLREVAVQKLSRCVLDPINRCTKQELHGLPSSKTGNCPLVLDLIETLRSREFKNGMDRLYWHENQEHPSVNKMFCKKLEVLKEIACQDRLLCVNTIQTVVVFNNQELQGTEEDSHLCYIERNEADTTVRLFVSHGTAQFSVDDFLEQLAGQIKEVLGSGCVKNELHIKSILKCRPSDISHVLDQLKIHLLDSTIVAEASKKSLDIGTSLPMCDVTFRRENLLIFCNFQIGEKVHYHCITDSAKPVLKVGSVVQMMECENQSAWSANKAIKLCTAGGNDVVKQTIEVSFFHVYKELTTFDYATLSNDIHQMQYSSPLIVLPVPQDKQEIYTWLRTIIKRNSNRPYCLMTHLRQRLLAHLHYYFMNVLCDSELYLFSTQMLFEMLKNESNPNHCARVSALDEESIVEKLKQLSIKDDNDDNDEVELEQEQLDDVSLLGHGYKQVADLSLVPVPTSVQSQSQFSVPKITLPLLGTGGNVFGQNTRPTAKPRFSLAQNKNSSSQSRYVAAVPTVVTDPVKAKAWFLQAKVDYLAARDILTTFKMTEFDFTDDSWMEVDTNYDIEADGRFGVVESAATSNGDPECKYPALVCFLCHEVVEKCMKAVMYAKTGLPTRLLDCRNLKTVHEYLNEAKKCPKAVLKCLLQCTTCVTEYEHKCRYPNYHHPARVPAQCYRFIDAVEALRAVNGLMKSVKESSLGKLIGELDVVQDADINRALDVCIKSNTDIPNFWDDLKDSTLKLVLLDHHDNEECGLISSQFHTSLPSSIILRVERIQNKILWRKYMDCGRRMLENNNGRISEQMLFHGTRHNKPELIYKGDASFDMRYSSTGLWGKGNYFAVNASYSDRYAHQCINGQYQMLMAYVLCGYTHTCPSDKNLTHPPFRTNTNGVEIRYDSVSGITNDSKVFITYNNDQAYPAYLITYK